MRQQHETLSINAQGRRLYDITPQVLQWVQQSGIHSGLLTLYIQHTSASLLINENYDRDVLVDLEAFFNRLVPPFNTFYFFNGFSNFNKRRPLKCLIHI